MSIPILVEPSPSGFLATTGGPLALSAEAASAAEAVASLQRKIVTRFERGAVLIDHPSPAPCPPAPVLSLAENPLFDEWLAAVETYRNAADDLERACSDEAN